MFRKFTWWFGILILLSPQASPLEAAEATGPSGAVRVDIFESIPNEASWAFAVSTPSETYDGCRPVKDFNNLGIPKRAWEFTSLSNERGRSALSLPKAQ